MRLREIIFSQIWRDFYSSPSFAVSSSACSALLCTRKDEADPDERLPGGPWGEAENIVRALEAIDMEAEGEKLSARV